MGWNLDKHWQEHTVLTKRWHDARSHYHAYGICRKTLWGLHPPVVRTVHQLLQLPRLF